MGRPQVETRHLRRTFACFLSLLPQETTSPADSRLSMVPCQSLQVRCDPPCIKVLHTARQCFPEATTVDPPVIRTRLAQGSSLSCPYPFSLLEPHLQSPYPSETVKMKASTIVAAVTVAVSSVMAHPQITGTPTGASVGSTITHPPASSGWGGFGPYGGPNGNNWGSGAWSSWTSSWPSSVASAWSSYTSAHPNGPSTSDWASFTSQYSISNAPWGTAGPYGPFGGMGGPMGPGMGGWHPGNGGPFGAGGWGPWGSSGSWTNGPWTSWWDGSACPPSDWAGWTTGSWSSTAPWTSWTACSASATTTSVYTATSGSVVYTSTSYGYKVAEATNSGTSGGATPSPTANAAPKNVAVGAAGVAAILGVVAAL